MAETIHQQIERERNDAMPEASLIQQFRLYAKGRQRSTLARDQRDILGQVLGHRFADNICLEVLRAVAGRVLLTGWQVDNPDAQGYLDELRTKTALLNLAAQIHFAAPRDGTTALALNWLPERDLEGNPIPGSGRVTLHHEPWWDGKTGMFVAKDADGQTAYAVKDFTVWFAEGDSPGERLRRTILFPDRIERYIKQGSGWLPFPDSTSYVSPWRKRNGQPLHVPVVMFVYDADHDTDYGTSELDGGILGLQDEVNDIQRDITAAARLTAFQQYFLSGKEPESDPSSGKLRPFKTGPGMVHQAGNPQADMKAIGAGDISQLIKSYQHKQQTIAHNTSTPLHLITGGDWPSGSALIQADTPLVIKADRFITSITPAWAEVAHRAIEIANTFGGVGISEDPLITPVFEDTQRLDELTRRQVQSEEVALYADLMRLPKALIEKTNILTKAEIAAVVQAQRERDNALNRRFDRGDVDPVVTEDRANAE